MRTTQPAWHCIANIADASPFDNGGDFVLVDRLGTYEAELWHWEPENRTLYQVCLDLCTPCPGDKDSVSDNRFHPDFPAWFGHAGNLAPAAAVCGLSAHELVSMLTSRNPVERAEGYRVIAAYHGWHELDHDPDKLDRREADSLCRRFLRQAARADAWPEGLAK